LGEAISFLFQALLLVGGGVFHFSGGEFGFIRGIIGAKEDGKGLAGYVWTTYEVLEDHQSGIRDQRDLKHGWDDLVLVWVHGILGNEIKVGYRTMYVLLAQLWTMNEGFFYSWMGFQVGYGWW
jgi:hypothetical protein